MIVTNQKLATAIEKTANELGFSKDEYIEYCTALYTTGRTNNSKTVSASALQQEILGFLRSAALNQRFFVARCFLKNLQWFDFNGHTKQRAGRILYKLAVSSGLFKISQSQKGYKIYMKKRNNTFKGQLQYCPNCGATLDNLIQDIQLKDNFKCAVCEYESNIRDEMLFLKNITDKYIG